MGWTLQQPSGNSQGLADLTCTTHKPDVKCFVTCCRNLTCCGNRTLQEPVAGVFVGRWPSDAIPYDNSGSRFLVPTLHGPPAPLGSFRDRPPAGTCRNTHADRRARLRRTELPPLYPLRSIRRSQGRGVGHQIAIHTCQLLGPTVPYPDTSAIRSSPPGCFRIRLRIPPSLSWRNIGACRPPGWQNRA